MNFGCQDEDKLTCDIKFSTEIGHLRQQSE